MYYLRTEHSFDSAHFLKGYKGKCRNIHGHRWRIIIEIANDSLIENGPKKGMLVDFGDIKSAIKALCDELDHCLIFEKDSLKEETIDALNAEKLRLFEVEFVPTAENFAKYFFEKMKEYNYPIHKVQVYETPNNCAVYEE